MTINVKKATAAIDTITSGFAALAAALAAGAAVKDDDDDDDDLPAAKPAKRNGKAAAAPAKKGRGKAVDFDTLKAKFAELIKAKGKESAKEVLATFDDAEKLADLDEADYAKAYKAAQEAIDAEEDSDDDDDL